VEAFFLGPWGKSGTDWIYIIIIDQPIYFESNFHYELYLRKTLVCDNHFRNNNVFIILIRRAFDYTGNYGSDVSSGMLTPHLANQISNSVESIIIDGEMMCWHTKKHVFTTKG